MNLLKDLLKANYKTIQRFTKSFAVDPQIGTSLRETDRVEAHPPFTAGKTKIFGQNFEFSHGPSYVHSLEEIFADDLYKFETATKAPLIIDCGANYGLSVLYFRKLFPNAHIIAYEPDEAIFEMLKRNVDAMPNPEQIELHKKAVWTQDTTLEFFSEGAMAGSVHVDYGAYNKKVVVDAIDFKKVLDKKVDFLKIDIEGAENDVIFDIKDKLHLVENLFLEYHGLHSEKQNLGDILQLLSICGFHYIIKDALPTLKKPYIQRNADRPYSMQLNIICYRP
jgi:FkbM family methyltransferase